MDEVWSFRRGTWSSVASPIQFVDADGEQLEQLDGYGDETLWLGLEGGFQVEVYTRLKGTQPAQSPYLAILYTGGDNREYVFVEDLPSLIQFLNLLAPIIQCSNEDIEAERDFEEDGWDDEEEEEEDDNRLR